ncbi:MULTISPECIES: hypothetical protein [Nostoc]|uniref:Uncharacterized protein n=1 Tax=Nostoc linckia FACHB-391 TaxID=2692906 RepID=A0ABR8F8D9_NOSLI|nr:MULTISPECIES: hypothetical protein [Nostoc]MBD2565135.1 hypothetical protein [Nostoc linckia FACHB-391]NEU83985.1 hypothetical protein [Nostoc sp. UIC 10630]
MKCDLLLRGWITKSDRSPPRARSPELALLQRIATSNLENFQKLGKGSLVVAFLRFITK